jgi:argininosuccinate lyase
LLNGTVPRALDEAVAIARLTASVLDGIELRTERFDQIARDSFVTAADVADVLALTGEVDYRSAHTIVGRAVRDLVDAGEPSSQLTPERLAAAAVAAIGRSVEIDEATLRDALDPAACAAARRQTGSSSQAAMDEMLDGLHATLTANESWSETARERESAAETALLARANDLASA